MRTLTTILIILFIKQSVNAQTTLNYTFIDECDNSIKNMGFSAFSYTTSSLILSDSNKTIVVPPGPYMIFVYFTRGDKKVTFSFFRNIENQTSYLDTIRIPRLIGRVYGSSIGFVEFTFCDSLADGYYEDYYYNGKIRLKGTFRKGCPEDIKFYNVEGKLCRKELYKDCWELHSKEFKKASRILNY